MWKTFQDAFGFSGTLGTIIGAVSVFNLIVKGFDVGLAPMLDDIVAVYESIFHGLFDWLVQWLGWRAPDWVKDAFALYLVGGAATFRSVARMSDIGQELGASPRSRLNIILEALMVAVLWPLMIGVLTSRAPVVAGHDTPHPDIRTVFMQQVTAVVLGVIILFLLNSSTG